MQLGQVIRVAACPLVAAVERDQLARRIADDALDLRADERGAAIVIEGPHDVRDVLYE